MPYYHVVFTLPHHFNTLLLYNKALLYTVFFKAASATLDQFGHNDLHGQLGYIGILHTWGQKLGPHIHLHFIVLGGALSYDHKQWISLPYPSKFLFPVKKMSKVFRGIFIKKLKRIYVNGLLSFPDDLQVLKEPMLFDRYLDQSLLKKWELYAKPPFAGPQQMITYLGSYIHRVAISNYRLKAFDGETISFTYKDYKDHCKTKTLTLKADEFIRRFLLHVLPHGFKKLRFFGFMANHLRTECIRLIANLITKDQSEEHRHTSTDRPKTNRCPICKKGQMVFRYIIKSWQMPDDVYCWNSS